MRLAFWSMLSLGPLALGLWWLAGFSPATVEWAYSRGIYALVMAPWSRLWAAVDLAVAPVVVVALVVAFLAAFLILPPLRVLAGSAAVVSVLLAWFVLGWGLNYQRLSWAESHHWTATGGTVTQLKALAQRLNEGLGPLRASLYRDVAPDWSLQSVRDAVIGAYDRAGQADSTLPPGFAGPKVAPLAQVLSWSGIAGIFIPHFGEPLVNSGPQDCQTPFVAAHECAHLRGWAREDEANFLAYWVLRESPDLRLQYSARSTGLLYVASALVESGDAGRQAWDQVSASVDEGVRLDWKTNREYWQRFKGPVREAVQAVNDAYLKSQGQSDGVKSYGRMVDLLLAAPE